MLEGLVEQVDSFHKQQKDENCKKNQIEMQKMHCNWNECLLQVQQ